MQLNFSDLSSQLKLFTSTYRKVKPTVTLFCSIFQLAGSQYTMTYTEYYDMAVLLTNAQFVSMDSAHLFLQPVNCEQSLCLCGTMVKYDIEQTNSITENYKDKILQKCILHHASRIQIHLYPIHHMCTCRT